MVDPWLAGVAASSLSLAIGPQAPARPPTDAKQRTNGLITTVIKPENGPFAALMLGILIRWLWGA